ncbi:unnamed protein product [Albugo candida]|uniref:DUF4442 domain-containing protein n=1 Tax=Albugo candida TaxID=65357 RepID=A0A024GGR2_9STRA|nr:unnamed protein product [Albugo candida]|eukprot:CCI45730.1 unnamed protein product [Albugo candida]
MSTPKNVLARYVAKINGFGVPDSLKSRAFSLLFNTQVKMAWLCGIKVETWNQTRATASLKNRLRVQNHIGSIHACGMALLAESTTGMVFGINVPETCVPLLKSMKIDYNRRATGDLSAVATLTPDQITSIQSMEKGSVRVGVQVRDSEEKEPIECEVVWAWTTKKRK